MTNPVLMSKYQASKITEGMCPFDNGTLERDTGNREYCPTCRSFFIKTTQPTHLGN